MKRFSLQSLLCIVVLLIAIWLRAPLVGKGLPYFDKEDEAHHFNRTVNMVKTGDYNPHYFHKPSLHFYLRMPIVALSFLWNVSKGHIKSVEEIRTGDPFGLNGYAFAASHPGIVKWNRSFSLVLSLISIMTVFLIGRSLFSFEAGISAAFLTAISPALLSESTVIGVDILMTTMSLLTLLICLKLHKKFSIGLLFLLGLSAGLTISSKYNAFPIAILPLLVLILDKKLSTRNLIIALAAPALGFILGTPYALVSLPTFLDHTAYEIWHYGVEGHIGHSAEPGLEQMLFYSSWLTKDALGFGAVALSIIGLFVFTASKQRRLYLVLAFPVLFFLYMSMQRANFTRNMVVVIPFLTLIGFGSLSMLLKLAKFSEKKSSLIFFAIMVAASIQPFFSAVALRDEAATQIRDTRSDAFEWVLTQSRDQDFAISGNLNFIPQIYGLKGVTRIDERKINPSGLYLSGFDKIITGPDFTPTDQQLKLLHLERYFAGKKEYERVILSPEIKVYKFTDDINQQIETTLQAQKLRCQESENYCWANSRITKLEIDLSKIKREGKDGVIELELMTPWTGQKVEFSLADWKEELLFKDEQIGHWIKVHLSVPYERLAYLPALKLTIAKIHSPSSQKISEDQRRLGIAVKTN